MSPTPAPDETTPRPAADRLPPQSTMGLLDYLTAHALDEDYAYASQRRPAPTGRSRRRRIGPVGAAALVAFGLLVVVAGAQTSQSAANDARNRDSLAAQVSAQRERLSAERERIAALQVETALLQELQLAGDDSAQQLQQRVERLGVLTGSLAVRGPGVEVVADDAPNSDSDRTRVLDTDLQRLVNGFWAAGAEAISINGQRLTNLSTIRLAGDAITVNARSLRPPYTLRVIGDPDTLPARFAETSSGQAWLDLQQSVRLQLTISPREELDLPASRTTLRFAESQAREEAGNP
jgi:uncharacterized protein YlxW (UPF0749 family)